MYIYRYIHTHTYIHVYICMYVCIYIYIYQYSICSIHVERERESEREISIHTRGPQSRTSRGRLLGVGMATYKQQMKWDIQKEIRTYKIYVKRKQTTQINIWWGHGMAWHGMAWHGMAKYKRSKQIGLKRKRENGMAWHGTARHGIYDVNIYIYI